VEFGWIVDFSGVLMILMDCSRFKVDYSGCGCILVDFGWTFSGFSGFRVDLVDCCRFKCIYGI